MFRLPSSAQPPDSSHAKSTVVEGVSAVTVTSKMSAGPGPHPSFEVVKAVHPPQSSMFVSVTVEVQIVRVGPLVKDGATTITDGQAPPVASGREERTRSAVRGDGGEGVERASWAPRKTSDRDNSNDMFVLY